MRATHRARLNLRRNKHVKTMAATAEALANEIASVASREAPHRDGSYTVRRVVLTVNTGHSAETITAHLEWLKERGLIAK